MLAYIALGVVLSGIWRGSQRQSRHSSGLDAFAVVLFAHYCIVRWRQLPGLETITVGGFAVYAVVDAARWGGIVFSMNFSRDMGLAGVGGIANVTVRYNRIKPYAHRHPKTYKQHVRRQSGRYYRQVASA
jgi:hypothetical protein